MEKTKGFTLVEMAVVLVIVGLLLGGLIAPIRTQMEQQRVSDTKKSLEEIKEALYGYAVGQPGTTTYLPCPDKTTAVGPGTANDGLQDFTAATGVCAAAEGNIPWATLGVAPTDSWGNHFHYAVTLAFANQPPGPPFTLGTLGTLTVNDPTLPPPGTVATGLPAVILSSGRNGFGAINSTGGTNVAPTSTPELENTDLDPTFVSMVPSAPGSTNGEFDDLVAWLSPGVLFNRKVAAGKP